MRIRSTGLALLVLLVLGAPARGDRYEITIDAAAAGPASAGRLVLLFVTPSHPRWRTTAPLDAPFFDAPQPIFSMAVDEAPTDGRYVIEGSLRGFPGTLDELDGPVRLQAVLDVDRTERSFADGPGNLLSDVVEVELGADRDDRVALTLRHAVRADRALPELPNLRWIELRSRSLSRFYGRDVFHRAGVALPLRYDREPEIRWPAIYVIPGFGGRHLGAAGYARMLQDPTLGEYAPDTVHIVLDPESPLGHHGFVDSPHHGPRGTALVEELIPHLEREFRLIARPEARLVTGHSSGGWSSLWLALRRPDVFGPCWSSAPDPVDFSAFQMTDLYRDRSVYELPDGEPTPSLRRLAGIDRTVVRMTVRQEALMEQAIDPHGRSGQQWDAWEAMFSPSAPDGGGPQRLFDRASGAIDRAVVEHWSRFDIAKLVTSDWERYRPLFAQRIRIACGTLDSFYLDRAVTRLRDRIASHGGSGEGPGYILLVDGATHDNLLSHIFIRWNEEMRAEVRRIMNEEATE